LPVRAAPDLVVVAHALIRDEETRAWEGARDVLYKLGFASMPDLERHEHAANKSYERIFRNELDRE
jgi:hypothetical protein